MTRQIASATARQTVKLSVVVVLLETERVLGLEKVGGPGLSLLNNTVPAALRWAEKGVQVKPMPCVFP